MVGSIGRLSERAPVGRRPPRTSQVKSRPSLKFIRGFSLFTRGRGCYLSLLFQATLPTSYLNEETRRSCTRFVGFYNWTLLAVLLIRITERVFENNPI